MIRCGVVRSPAATGWRLLLAAVLLGLAGCAANPVTGKSELSFISESEEISIGTENYLSGQQSQGGEYTLDPALNAYVRDVGMRLAKVSDRPNLPYEFVVLNDSTPNAWAMPGGKIAINRGLLTELENEAELAAVLGHEIVHAAARHGAQSMERGVLLQSAVAGLGVAASASGYGGYSDLVVGTASTGAELVNKSYGRDAERESDFYGMRYMSKAGYDPAAAVSLQEKFVKLSGNRTAGWVDGLFASHPPSQERVEANRAHLAKLPTGGRLGEAEYQAKVAGLKRDAKAYALQEKGRKALADGNAAGALALARSAQHIQPKEAGFYSLQGDALLAKGEEKQALAAYDAAVKRDEGYFQYHLQRGVVRYKLGQADAARQDLERANALLPTAPAHYVLGEIAASDNRTREATEHFRVAASSNSEVGRLAAASLAKLEIGSSPQNFVAAAVQVDGGRYVVLVQNQAAVAVTGVSVRVQLADAAGRVLARDQVTVPGRIAPGDTLSVPSNLQGLVPGASRGDAQVVSARVVE